MIHEDASHEQIVKLEEALGKASLAILDIASDQVPIAGLGLAID